MSRTTQNNTIRPGRAPKQHVKDLVAKIRREVKRRAVAEGHIEDPAKKLPKWEWHWALGERIGGMVRANTKGESRALIRDALGLRKGQVFPRSLRIYRVDPNASQFSSVESPSPSEDAT